jgi:RHS repeat-associated protein
MYLPFGGTRWESGSTPTDFQFTGQRKEAGFGLYDYNARYYDPTIGRFVSATIRLCQPIRVCGHAMGNHKQVAVCNSSGV